MDRIRAWVQRTWASGLKGKAILLGGGGILLVWCCCGALIAIGSTPAARQQQATAAASAAQATSAPTVAQVVVEAPTQAVEPTAAPVVEPTAVAAAVPTAVPTAEPTTVPTATPEPTVAPTEVPTVAPTEAPAAPAELGVSRADIVKWFDNFTFAPSTAVKGRPREMGRSRDKEINIELIGDPSDLHSTAMLTSLPYADSTATQGRMLGAATLMFATFPDKQEKVKTWLSETYQLLGKAAKSGATFERRLDVDERRELSVIATFFDDGAVFTVTGKVKE